MYRSLMLITVYLFTIGHAMASDMVQKYKNNHVRLWDIICVIWPELIECEIVPKLSIAEFEAIKKLSRSEQMKIAKEISAIFLAHEGFPGEEYLLNFDKIDINNKRRILNSIID